MTSSAGKRPKSLLGLPLEIHEQIYGLVPTSSDALWIIPIADTTGRANAAALYGVDLSSPQPRLRSNTSAALLKKLPHSSE
jgi:hypothetical protein